MAARAAGPQPQRAVPGSGDAGAGAVRRAAAAPAARRARRQHRGAERRRRPALRARALPGRVLPARRLRRRRAQAERSPQRAPRPRRDRLVRGRRWHAPGRARRLAARRAARPRGHPRGQGRAGVAGDGRLLRGGRPDPRPRRRPVPPHRHPPHVPPSRGPRRRPGRRRHRQSAGAVRVGIRPPLVRAAGRRRRRGADAGGSADVLPVQGHRLLLRHRRHPARRVVVSRAVRRDGGDRRPGLLRTRQGRGHLGRRAARARAGTERHVARHRSQPEHRRGRRPDERGRI